VSQRRAVLTPATRETSLCSRASRNNNRRTSVDTSL